MDLGSTEFITKMQQLQRVDLQKNRATMEQVIDFFSQQ